MHTMKDMPQIKGESWRHEMPKNREVEDEDIIKEKFKDSVFNKCSHQKIMSMKNKEFQINLFIDNNTEPHSAKGIRYVPMNMEVKVKSQIDQNVRMGVIRKVQKIKAGC